MQHDGLICLQSVQNYKKLGNLIHVMQNNLYETERDTSLKFLILINYLIFLHSLLLIAFLVSQFEIYIDIGVQKLVIICVVKLSKDQVIYQIVF